MSRAWNRTLGWLPESWRDRLDRFAREWAVAVLAGLVALMGVAKIGEDVFAHESGTFDGAVRQWMLAHQWPAVVSVFRWITAAGSVPVMVSISVVAALFLFYRKGRRVGAAALIAPAIATSLFLGAKQIYARPRPTGLGHALLGTYSFPSGHATASTAICCTLAYIYWREGLVSGKWALGFAVTAPLLIGISRVYLDVHWATDVLGGWSAGLLVAVVSLVLYDRNRYRQLRADARA